MSIFYYLSRKPLWTCLNNRLYSTHNNNIHIFRVNLIKKILKKTIYRTLDKISTFPFIIVPYIEL